MAKSKAKNANFIEDVQVTTDCLTGPQAALVSTYLPAISVESGSILTSPVSSPPSERIPRVCPLRRPSSRSCVSSSTVPVAI